MASLILSNHAKERAKERGVSLKEIHECVEFSDYKVTKDNKVEMFKKINNKVLRLVCVQENKFIKVITLMWK